MSELTFTKGPAASIGRMLAIVQRQGLLYKRTMHRWADLFFWPVLDLVLFGFIQLYLTRQPGALSHAATFFLGAVILWDLLFRSQQAVSMGFLEDVWSRNVLNVWASPIRPSEYIGGSIITGILRVMAGTTVAVVIARAFYDFNLFGIGVALVPLIIGVAAMGWALGIVATAIILRLGEGAETVAWALGFVFQPVSAVFYPVEVLPGVLQPVARAVPATHAFTGMRQVLNGGGFPGREIAMTLALDVVYLTVASSFFAWMLRQVRERGLLARFGE